jgi:hypothetical protein
MTYFSAHLIRRFSRVYRSRLRLRREETDVFGVKHDLEILLYLYNVSV